MKKIFILLMAMAAFVTTQAQWVNDPANNTLIANTSADAGEIYLSTDPVSGDTYVQWTSSGSNGWGPTLQRLNFEGVPQWGADGIHISGHNFASWSQGIAMTSTRDGGVVSCFSNYDGQSAAVRINADGTFPWGEQGITLFNGGGGSRTEIAACSDGGVWVLGSDYTNLLLQYISPNGALSPMVTINNSNGDCLFGQLTVSDEDRVFVTYEVLGSGMYTDKQIFVAGYSPDGTSFSPATQLMASQTFQSTYIHSAISDGMGGGYVYIWHPGIYESFNTYVFHFNANGASTITDPNGIAVHSVNTSAFYLSANATVDPITHDLILAYQETDSETQNQCKLWINRITSTGDRIWEDGILILDNGTIPCGGLRIDAFEYGDGFSVIYHKGLDLSGYQSTVEAKGFDMEGNATWNTQMCSNTYPKTGDENSTGFYGGQNIVAWVNSTSGGGGLYGQNIGQNGEMGTITPPTPPTPCYAPENFEGRYYYDGETLPFGAQLTWTAPVEQPLHYNLYREQLGKGITEVIEIDGSAVEYNDEVEIGDYTYRLTAVHEDCESDYALTTTGEDYVFIEVTSIDENDTEEIVTLLKVYTLNGQLLRTTNLEELSHGVYILQGVTTSGQLVNRKMMVKND